jgi:hypothetical protein
LSDYRWDHFPGPAVNGYSYLPCKIPFNYGCDLRANLTFPHNKVWCFKHAGLSTGLIFFSKKIESAAKIDDGCAEYWKSSLFRASNHGPGYQIMASGGVTTGTTGHHHHVLAPKRHRLTLQDALSTGVSALGALSVNKCR